MKFAVILSGSGVYDGSEIHEATFTLWAIDKNGSSYQCFAPDIEQHHVINHITGEELHEKRNVLIESARIARGNIKPLSELKSTDYDAVVFPGGFGMAKNLSTLAFDGANCTVNKEVERVVLDMVSNNKPIGALCISPAIIAKVLKGAEVTIGNDKNTTEAIENMGGKHIVKSHGEVTIDKKYKLVTTPCYMLDATISQIAEGAENVIKTILEM
jgi:enhancing lycopene biosynthesis protein 2